VFENRVLRRIFGPKGDEVTGGGELNNEEIHNLYSWPRISINDLVNEDEIGGACSTNWREKECI
jgi:hypothetical protein